MGAEPAHQDPEEQPTLLQRSAKIIRFPKRKKDQETPEQAKKQNPTPAEKIPGEWESITTVWTDSPEPLCSIIEQISQLREEGTPQSLALAAWAVIVLPPRAALHLTSWLLSHPTRFTVGATLIIIFIATL